MNLAHLALFSFLDGASGVSPGVESAAPAGIFVWFDGASPVAPLSGGVESAAPSGIFTWFDGASPAGAPQPSQAVDYVVGYRRRRRSGRL